MKKTLLILGIILACSFVLFSVIDTSGYAVEKRLWRVQKQYDQIAKDPKVVPEQKFEETAEQYRRIIKKYPDSQLIPKVYLQVGRVYVLKKDMAKARETFQEIPNRFDDAEVCAEAVVYIGNSYEMEGNEALAVKTYKQVIDNYPLTDIGLNMPLYIANYYLKVNKLLEAQSATRQAVSFYKKVIKEQKNPRIVFNALRVLATTYLVQKNWEEAVNTLSKILFTTSTKEYLNNQRAALIINSINTISVTQLKDYDVPIGIYKKFIEQYPEHAFNKLLKGSIKALEELKEKNVVISTTQDK